MSKLKKIIQPMNLQYLRDNFYIDYLIIKPICGIYFLVDNEIVVYVGQSEDIYCRIKQHTDKQFDTAYFLRYSKELLDEKETEFIVGFNPKYNKTHCYDILLNKYRLENKKISKFAKHCIEYDNATDACMYLNLK